MANPSFDSTSNLLLQQHYQRHLETALNQHPRDLQVPPCVREFTVATLVETSLMTDEQVALRAQEIDEDLTIDTIQKGLTYIVDPAEKERAARTELRRQLTAEIVEESAPLYFPDVEPDGYYDSKSFLNFLVYAARASSLAMQEMRSLDESL